jgi:hypothetical protein
MHITKKVVSRILKQIHPDASIDTEAVSWLHEMFQDYIDKDADTILGLLPGELNKHAKIEYEKKGDIEDIFEYLLAEILELSGNCARDQKKMRITAYHMWLAILNDVELAVLFKRPNVPVLLDLNMEAIKVHGSHRARALKGKITQRNSTANIFTFFLILSVSLYFCFLVLFHLIRRFIHILATFSYFLLIYLRMFFT